MLENSLQSIETHSVSGKAPRDDLSSSSGASSKRNWHAKIELGYDRPSSVPHGSIRTQMNEMRFVGPLRVQRPFYPEGEVCHTYLLHPPGGMVSGDELEIDVRVSRDAHALVTTPSAGKIYRSDSHDIPQKQSLRLTVTDGVLEWLPQENIFFNDSHAQLRTNVHLSQAAKLIAWDMVALGRQAGNEPYVSGKFSSSMELYIDDKPVLIEGFQFDAELEMLTSVAGLQGFTHFGTMLLVAHANAEQVIEMIRELVPNASASDSELVCAVTLKNQASGLVVVRSFSNSAEQLRNLFISVWQAVRLKIVEKPPCLPRIWNT